MAPPRLRLHWMHGARNDAARSDGGAQVAVRALARIAARAVAASAVSRAHARARTRAHAPALA